jgi:hypothetical protein
VKTKNKIIVWKGNCLNTTEFVEVETGESIAVNGHITGEVEGTLLHVSYKLTVDLLWNIKAVYIDCQSDAAFKISLTKQKNNQWCNEKGEWLSQYDGCTDIDISITPFTNTLPINRLHLPVGSSKEDIVLYINLPTSECKPVKQRYTNLGDKIYKYENLVTGFISNIEVDEDGYVVNYPGIWYRIFPKNNA